MEHNHHTAKLLLGKRAGWIEIGAPVLDVRAKGEDLKSRHKFRNECLQTAAGSRLADMAAGVLSEHKLSGVIGIQCIIIEINFCIDGMIGQIVPQLVAREPADGKQVEMPEKIQVVHSTPPTRTDR
jgi:hypothetical protein